MKKPNALVSFYSISSMYKFLEVRKSYFKKLVLFGHLRKKNFQKTEPLCAEVKTQHVPLLVVFFLNLWLSGSLLRWIGFQLGFFVQCEGGQVFNCRVFGFPLCVLVAWVHTKLQVASGFHFSEGWCQITLIESTYFVWTLRSLRVVHRCYLSISCQKEYPRFLGGMVPHFGSWKWGKLQFIVLFHSDLFPDSV